MKRPLNRRKFIGGAAFAGLRAGSLSLVGCGGSAGGNSGLAANATSTPAGSQTSQNVKRGGTYTTATTASFGGVDPHTSQSGGSGIIPMVYNYLFRTEATPDAAAAKGILYDLATSYKLESDNITYTFQLATTSRSRPTRTASPNASWTRAT